MKYSDTTKAKLTNTFIDMHFNISPKCMDLLVYLLQRAYSTNESSEPQILHIDRSKLIGVAELQKNPGRLRPYLDELQTQIFKFDGDEFILSAPILVAHQYNAHNDTVSIEFSRLLWPYISKFIGNFTQIDITHLWLMRGQYVKRFYLDVMRWSGGSMMKLNIENMRNRYGMEYQYNDIIRRIVNPAINQIHELTNIRVSQLEVTKRGKRVLTLNFHINKPGREALQPLAEKLVQRYGLTPGFAAKVVERLAYRDIFAICEAIDARRMTVKNIGAYSAQTFKNYGITYTAHDNAKTG